MCALCPQYQADLPTPKSEKTGGGLKKTLKLSKKSGDFAKTSSKLPVNPLSFNLCLMVSVINGSCLFQ